MKTSFLKTLVVAFVVFAGFAAMNQAEARRIIPPVTTPPSPVSTL